MPFDGHIHILIGSIFYKLGWMMHLVILMHWIGTLTFPIPGLLLCLLDWFDKRPSQSSAPKMDG